MAGAQLGAQNSKVAMAGGQMSAANAEGWRPAEAKNVEVRWLVAG